MVTRLLLVVGALSVAACLPSGEHYLLRVTPTPRLAQTPPGGLPVDVTLVREDTSEAMSFQFQSPDRPLSSPWLFDAQTDSWGPAAILATVNVFGIDGTARGVGAANRGIIDVQLVDDGGFGPIDLAFQPPDLATPDFSRD